MIPFGRWQPDKFSFDPNLAGDARGVIPAPDGYLPWPQPVQVSAALAAACAGAYSARLTDQSIIPFAGTATKLYKLTDPTNPTDVSRPVGGNYNVATDRLWSFTQFGSTRLVASNVNDVMQYIDPNSGTNFAAVGGSPPQAAFVRTFGEFVVAGGISGHPGRLHWSGRNNSDFWTQGTQDCDDQDFPDGGDTTGLAPFGQGRAAVFQESCIRSMVATNGREIFDFQILDDKRGLIAPDSLVTVNGVAYGYSDQGFFATDGTGPAKAIGDDIVDKWFAGTVNRGRITAMRGCADPVHPRIMWLFPSSGNTSSILDMCICYEISNNAWSYCFLNGTVLFQSATPAYTADNIDALLSSLGYTLETAPFSFDATWLQGGVPYLGLFDSSFKMNFFSGSPMAVTLETSNQFPFGIARRTYIRGARPVIDSVDTTISFGVRETVAGDFTWTSPASLNSEGIAYQRTSGRIFRVRAEIPAGSDWTHAAGISFDDDGKGDPLIAPAGTR